MSILPLWSFVPVLHDWVHPLFILLLIPIIFYASRRSHYDRKITTLLLSGFILVVGGWGIGHLWLGILFETIATIAGSLVLISGHWFNYRHHRRCSNKSHKHHPIASRGESSSMAADESDTSQSA